MKLIVHLARLLVGLTFVFSGFVKLVDPLGSSYKFQEYFSPDVLNLEFLIPFALPFSILLILLELMLGITLLMGYLPKLTSWSLLVIITVFLYLTWYSAFYDKVTDCGCFGDAITLTPWETFYKNVVLLALILILVFRHKDIGPIPNLIIAKWTTFLSFIVSLFITYYVLVHLPIIDFRPYAIGKNLPEGMEFVGEELPPIHDFYLESLSGEEVTEKVLTDEKALLFVAYNLDMGDKEGFSSLSAISRKAGLKGYHVYMLTASIESTFQKFKNEFAYDFEMLFCDETTLKTIVRANPGIVILEKGTVMGKWNWVDADAIEF